MNNYPRISIVTVNYNKAQYLEDTIESVINQGYPNLEYIIIDGKSTDNSVDIIRKYDSKITYWISEPDKGMTDALIKGFNKATGEVLAWINSDDMYEKGTLFKVAELYQKKHFDFLYGGGCFIDILGKVTRCINSRPNNYKALGYGIIPLFQPSCFWSKQIYDRIGGLDPEFQVSMDGNLFVRILKDKDAKIIRTNSIFSLFRIHPEQSASWAPKGRYQEERKMILNYIGANKIEKLYYKFVYKYFSLMYSYLR